MKKEVGLMILFLYLLIGCSCSTPKFYKEIKSTYNTTVNKEKVIYSKDIHRDVLKLLTKALENTNHIIYFQEGIPTDNIKKPDYNIMIWDLDHQKYYTVVYRESGKQILFNEVPNTSQNQYFEFVRDYFLNNECDSLKNMGLESNHSGIRISHTIYEINLKENNINECSFWDIHFTFWYKESD
jgi:hypothetical protein